MLFELAPSPSPAPTRDPFVDFCGAAEAPPLTEAHAALRAAKMELCEAVVQHADQETLNHLGAKVDFLKARFFDAVGVYEDIDLVVIFVPGALEGTRVRAERGHLRVDEKGLVYFKGAGAEKRVRAEFMLAIVRPLQAAPVVN